MNYSEALKYIHSLGNFSLPPTLSRIECVLNKLSNPQNDFRSIHIAGTNGKGSVSVMLAEIFKRHGLKTGLYISPYIIDFRERIQINGEFISENDLIFYTERVKNTGVDLTEFEFITALAFLYYSDKKCDIVIAETGLGGRLDATNSLNNTAVTVITEIGLDHSAILGDTVEKIAKEKCGIIKSCPVTVTSPFQRKEALDVIKQNAEKLILPDKVELKILKSDQNGSSIIYKNKTYDISLCGEYQIENVLTVIETAWHSGYNIPYETVKFALGNTFFPARAEVISRNPLVILDGAHNPDGAKALSEILKKLNSKATAIIGVMGDKDYKTVLKSTLPLCKNAVAVDVVNMPRSLQKEILCKKANEYCPTVTAENYLDAIKIAKEKSGGEPIFVFGSLYLAAGIRTDLIKNFN